MKGSYAVPPVSGFDQAYEFHRTIAGYRPTPLIGLKSLAAETGVGSILMKDESERFGLNAFKGLGASYAAYMAAQKYSKDIRGFISCTDGNHGKALAWIAQKMGIPCRILMPRGAESRRIRQIEKYGASVEVMEMNYDDTVRCAAAEAEKSAWTLVQDTALPGYTEIPGYITCGYSTMMREVLAQADEMPTHLFIQAGVGSLAGGVIAYLESVCGSRLPFIGIIEAAPAACYYESAAAGKKICIGGGPETAMAGLNCGEPNFVNYPYLMSRTDVFIKCSDAVTYKGMERARHPAGTDRAFSSGECGAVGLGVIETVLTDPSYAAERLQLKLDSDSRILLFNTEGEIEDDE
jgi:diaminopropionate ammonia-lyase